MHDEPVIRFTVLGTLAVTIDGAAVDLGPPKQRLLLAMLLCRADSVVPVDQLTEALWADSPPRTARKNLQVYVANLRKAIGDRIRYAATGYVLRVERDELDLVRFESFAAAGRRLLRQGDRTGAVALLDSAIRCWRGPALVEFADVPAAVREADRLAGRFLSVYEDWADVQSELGNHAEILDSIDDVVSRHPYRERLGVARMSALARCGRGAEALAHYDETRQRMAREFGIQPSPVLTRLYRQILASHAGPTGVPPVLPEQRPTAGHRRWVPALPRDLPDLVGRRDEMAYLLAALGDSASGVDVLVLSGQAGTGKTVTAIRAAHRLSAGFADGAALVPLRTVAGRPRDRVDVVAELLRQTGFTGAAPADLAEAVPLCRSWLADRRMLLVLDSAADEESVRMLRPGLAGNRLLVTSRYRLSGLERASRVELAEFSTVEALDLLGALIGAGRLLRDHRAAQRLVELSGGLPLAVRVLGTRLATMRDVPLRGYAERLADDRALFDELAAGDVSVRGLFDEWIGSVPAPYREALRRLARLPGPVFGRAEVLDALAGGSGPAGPALAQLVECNLLSIPDTEVSAHGEVYRIPALLHRYIRAGLAGP